MKSFKSNFIDIALEECSISFKSLSGSYAHCMNGWCCNWFLLNEKAAVPVRLVLGSALLAYCNYGFVINGDAKLSRVELIPTALSMRRHTSRNSPTLVPSYWEKNWPRRLQTFKRGQGLMSYRKSRVKVTGYNSIYIVGLTNLSLFKSKLTDCCLCVVIPVI